MKEVDEGVNRRIAMRVRELREQRGFSLDALSQRSGVSRSMISVVERGESSPTAVVLDKLAAGLGVTLVALFEPALKGAPGHSGALSRREDQSEWKDPASGYVRRVVTPPGGQQPMNLVEVLFPAGGRVTFETGVRDRVVHQQIWILDGNMEITVGEARHVLHPGDCLAMELDRPVMFFNSGRRPARYLVVIADGWSAR